MNVCEQNHSNTFMDVHMHACSLHGNFRNFGAKKSLASMEYKHSTPSFERVRMFSLVHVQILNVHGRVPPAHLTAERWRHKYKTQTIPSSEGIKSVPCDSSSSKPRPAMIEDSITFEDHNTRGRSTSEFLVDTIILSLNSISSKAGESITNDLIAVLRDNEFPID